MSFTAFIWSILIIIVAGLVLILLVVRTKYWKMHLEDEPMDRIIRGEKVTEFRLWKPKWRGIQRGDIVEFWSLDELRFVRVKVLQVDWTFDFENLLRYYSNLGWLERPYDEQLVRLEKRYPESECRRYSGVFGLHFQVIST